MSKPFLTVLLALLSGGVHAFQSAALLDNQSRQQHARTSLFSTTITESSETSTKEAPPHNRRVSVLLCPAQFCVPADYGEFFENLKSTRTGLSEIGTCRVASLPRTEWIKVARQLPTKNFLDATLSAQETLGWYFTGIEKALQEIYSIEGSDANVCIIGHSIGGWVARGYLGGLAGTSTAVFGLTKQQCSSLVTIGTPHSSPEEALVDQTRGLLREIEETPSCSPQALVDLGVDVTCVGSSGIGGNFLTTNLEEFVAASSYLPLMGRLGMKGDGIVPLELAFMESPATKVVVDECSLTGAPVRHSHVVPTPWNLVDGFAPSLKLPDDFVSYVSEGVLPQWSKYIR